MLESYDIESYFKSICKVILGTEKKKKNEISEKILSEDIVKCRISGLLVNIKNPILKTIKKTAYSTKLDSWYTLRKKL